MIRKIIHDKMHRRALVICFMCLCLIVLDARWFLNQAVEQRFCDARLVHAIYHHNTQEALLQLSLGANPDVKDAGIMPISLLEAATDIYVHFKDDSADSTCEKTYSRSLPALVMVFADSNGRPRENILLVKALLDRGANVNEVDDEGDSAIFWAAANGNSASLELLVERGADVNMRDEMGNTALFEATGDCIRRLITYGVGVNAVNHRNETPLMHACRRMDIADVKTLIEFGANVNQVNSSGETPIFMAAEYADVEILRMLLAHGADLSVPNNNATTPLMIAACNKDPNVCEFLLQKCHNLNYKDKNGSTALTYAVKHNRAKNVQTLLRFGGRLPSK